MSVQESITLQIVIIAPQKYAVKPCGRVMLHKLYDMDNQKTSLMISIHPFQIPFLKISVKNGSTANWQTAPKTSY